MQMQQNHLHAQSQDRNIRPRLAAPSSSSSSSAQQGAPAAANPQVVYYQTLDRHYLPPKEIAEILVHKSLGDGNKKIETEYWAESLKTDNTISLVEVKDGGGGKNSWIFMKNEHEWTSPLNSLEEYNCAVVDPATKKQHPMKIIVAKTMNSVYFVRSPIRRSTITQAELNARSEAFALDDY